MELGALRLAVDRPFGERELGRDLQVRRGRPAGGSTAQRPSRLELATTRSRTIVGVDLDYENVGQSGGMLLVSASGTAVVCG